MKIKYLCMLSALLLLNVSCAKKTQDSSNVPMDSLPDSSAIPIETPTAPETTKVTTTPTKTTTTVTTTATIETTAPAIVTTSPTKKTDSVKTTAVPKTTTAPQSDPETEAVETISLSGIWEYQDYAGNRLEFRNDGSMVFWQEYSRVISISDGNLIMSNSVLPIEVNGTVVTATEDDNLVLSMTAEAGANMDSLQGKFSLNDCMVADNLGGAGKMIWVNGNELYFGVYSSYSINGDTLTIGKGAEAYDNTISLDGATLTITTGDGSEDILVKKQ